MLGKIFDFVISMLANLVQVVVWPINQLMTTLIPDISGKITDVVNGIAGLFTGVTWGLGLLPPVVIVTLLFIISVEIARHTIFISTHVLGLILDIIKRLKFW